MTDAEGNKTRFSHDTRGRLTQKTYAEGDGVQAAYTSNSLLQTFASGRGIVTTYKYDAAGLLTNTSYAATNTSTVRMSYDSRNRLGTLIDGWGTNSISYNNLNQVTQWLEVGVSSTQRFTFAYDPLGRTTNVLWQCATVSVQTAYSFDPLGRVTNITSDAGSFGYSFTNAGTQVSRLRYPNGETATWLYDSLGRMTNLAYSTGGSWSHSYDSRDQVATRVDPSTNVYAYKYDDQGRLIEATGLKGTNKVSGYPFAYSYDRVGNRVEQSENRAQRMLTYNDNNQLITYERPKSVQVRGYINEYTTNVVTRSNTATNWLPATVRFLSWTQSYFEADVTITNSGTNNYIWVRATDKSGNRSTNTVRVTSTPTSTAFSHDADGNQLTLSSTVSLSFDARNRPTRINYSDGYTVMKYDGFDRLREVAEYNSGSVLTSLVRYVWNGWTPWAELNSTNGIIRTFTFGVDLSGTVGGAAGIGGLLAIRQNGTNYYVRSDAKGNVTEVRTTNGAVVGAYSYSPFGKLLSQTNTYNQPFRFQSKLFHARSGFVYFGYRWLDPNTGRWLSRDPSGEGASINLYSYVGGNPVGQIDPLGLWGVQFGGVNLGVGNPWLAFDNSSWMEVSKGAAATLDGIIPFADPMESAYADECGNVDSSYQISRNLGAFSRDIYLGARIPNIGQWVKNPVLYEIGQTTVSPTTFNAIKGLSAIEKGRYLVNAANGSYLNAAFGTAWGEVGATIGTGLTPGGYLLGLGAFEAADYETRK